MKTSSRGLALIRKFESLRLEAYRDPAGVWTIGWGHTPAHPGQVITRDRANDLLRADIADAEAAVRALITAQLTQGQFDALVSFTYNLGAGRLRDSTLRELINNGELDAARDQFARWVYAGGRQLPGLVRRRGAEADLFATVTAADPAATQAPAPVSDATIQYTEAKPMSPFIVPALEALAGVLPAIKKAVFDKSQTVPERNAEAAIKLVEAAKQALDAPNEQALIERIKTDPESHATARQAMQSVWYEVTEAGGGGIAGARQFAADHEGGRFGRTLERVTYAALSFLAFANVAIFGAVIVALWRSSDYADQLLQMASTVLQADIGATLTGLAFWLGSSVSKNRGTQVPTP